MNAGGELVMYRPKRTAHGTVQRVAVGYDVVRVKALTAGVLATLDTDRDTFVGVGISHRW